MHKQEEIVTLIRQIAKKYDITYYQAENAVYARFSLARETMKKCNFEKKIFPNFRFYKFAMLYIPNITRKNICKLIEKHPPVKRERGNLTEDEVRKIKSLLAEGLTAYKIQKKYFPKMHRQTIYAIKNGKLWKDIK